MTDTNKQQLLEKLLWQYKLIQFFSWFSAVVFLLILVFLLLHYAKKTIEVVKLLGWASLVSFIGWVVFSSLWSVWETAAKLVKYV
ncbi:MAG: hypothetical protein MRERC_3c048 [Mycoplasmataceae bacterium RC_NB112A]|nr:MAG: hypothetical protein MRERC_3c048 [Mycoplasmataceae bacterium RC_NB112A]